MTDDESSSEFADSFLLKERKRTDAITRKESKEAIPIPRTLNPRASVVLATSPRPVSTSSSSPRTRSPSLGAAVTSTKSTSTSSTTSTKHFPEEEPRRAVLRRRATTNDERSSTDDDEIKLSYAREEKEYEEECAALQIKKEFISRTLKEKVYGHRKMVSSDVTFFEQPTGSETLSDFCVTERSTPYSTPPPERMMSSEVSNREIAAIKSEMRKIRDQMLYIGKQQQDVNNYYLEIKKAREEEKSKSSCCWF